MSVLSLVKGAASPHRIPGSALNLTHLVETYIGSVRMDGHGRELSRVVHAFGIGTVQDLYRPETILSLLRDGRLFPLLERVRGIDCLAAPPRGLDALLQRVRGLKEVPDRRIERRSLPAGLSVGAVVAMHRWGRQIRRAASWSHWHPGVVLPSLSTTDLRQGEDVLGQTISKERDLRRLFETLEELSPCARSARLCAKVTFIPDRMRVDFTADEGQEPRMIWDLDRQCSLLQLPYQTSFLAELWTFAVALGQAVGAPEGVLLPPVLQSPDSDRVIASIHRRWNLERAHAHAFAAQLLHELCLRIPNLIYDEIFLSRAEVDSIRTLQEKGIDGLAQALHSDEDRRYIEERWQGLLRWYAIRGETTSALEDDISTKPVLLLSPRRPSPLDLWLAFLEKMPLGHLTRTEWPNLLHEIADGCRRTLAEEFQTAGDIPCLIRLVGVISPELALNLNLNERLLSGMLEIQCLPQSSWTSDAPVVEVPGLDGQLMKPGGKMKVEVRAGTPFRLLLPAFVERVGRYAQGAVPAHVPSEMWREAKESGNYQPIADELFYVDLFRDWLGLTARLRLREDAAHLRIPLEDAVVISLERELLEGFSEYRDAYLSVHEQAWLDLRVEELGDLIGRLHRAQEESTLGPPSSDK